MNKAHRAVTTIIGIGDLTVDTLVYGLDRLPAWGTEYEVEELERRLGGNLGNLAAGAAALKLPLRCIGPIGRDAPGSFILSELARLGQSTDGILTLDEVPTSQTIALVRRDGERLFITLPGALVRLEHMLRDRPLPPGEVVFLTGWCQPPRIPFATLTELVTAWTAEGRQVLIDLSWSERSWQQCEELLDILRHVDWVLLNEAELEAITGLQDYHQGLQHLRNRITTRRATGSQRPGIVLKRGSHGAALLSAGELIEAPAPAIMVRETVGAGDLFNAGFLHAHCRKQETPERALQFAVAFAGLALQAGRAALPNETAVLENLGWRI